MATNSFPGRTDDLFWKIARCSGPKGGRNACRSLNRLIAREGLSIPVELRFVELTCRRKRPKIEDIQLQWPVLSMRSWAHYLLEQHPQLILGGHTWKQDWKTMFGSFWDQWKEMEPDHEIFSSGKPFTNCIPFLTHGDEGQTLRKTAFMVQSWQPVISWQGVDVTTMSGLLATN